MSELILTKKSYQIVYEDNHIIVVNKAPGLLVQGDSTGDVSLFSLIKEYIKNKYNKPGNVYLGLVHRLDRPTSGLIVFARTSKAAKRLSEQFRDRTVSKSYLALVSGCTPKKAILKHKIFRIEKKSYIGNKPDSKNAHLEFERIWTRENISKIKILLLTGRHHQIRVQLAYEDFPILGDILYGSDRKFLSRGMALHSHTLTITHPTKQERITFTEKPEFWPKKYL